MSASTNIKSGSIVTYEIKINGSPVSELIQVNNIEILSGFNKISSARISVIDGDSSKGSFNASSSKDFVPGNTIEISAGYDMDNELIFKGIITKQNIKIDHYVGSILEVVCRDEAIKMAVGRKTRTFTRQKDSNIMQSIIGNYSGLSSNVTATQTDWPEQVQYYTSDWDFITSRAETNGMIVTTLNSKVSVFPPDKDTSPVLNVEYGHNLLSFDADLNSLNQYGSVQARSWDFETQKIVNAKASSSLRGPGNLSTQKLSEVVGLHEYELQTTAPLETVNLTNWSKSELVKSEYAKIQGNVSFQGSNLVAPGKYITLDGLGDRFNGGHLLSQIIHRIQDGNWLTEASFGLSATWCTEEPEVMAPPASGLLPGVQGLYNGTVKQVDKDPDNQYRVLVHVPLFDASGDGVWARLSNFYATSGAGAFFLPEVGDEVVLGFLNQDPRFPIVLGSMYSSSKNKPYESIRPAEKNPKKDIVSKSGIYIEFDDENKVFTIQTPGQNQLVFSDKDRSITIKDQYKNSFELSESGIKMKSPKDISIHATQSLNLIGEMGISIEASAGDVITKALNIKNDANVQFSANGDMSAELTGGAQTTITGAMVMIN